MSKYKDLIQQAKNPDNQQTEKPESQITISTDNQQSVKPESQIKEKEVNLCIKVPLSKRQHWAAEAKRQGTTLKAIISKALEDILGLPD